MIYSGIPRGNYCNRLPINSKKIEATGKSLATTPVAEALLNKSSNVIISYTCIHFTQCSYVYTSNYVE